MPSTLLANRLSLVRLHNAVAYALSAILYSVILYVLEQVSPGEYVFPLNHPKRDAFMIISVISWVVMGIGVAILLVFYFPIRSKKSRGYASLPRSTLILIMLALLAISTGLAASAVGAYFVYDGTRARYKLFYGDRNRAREIVVPVITGILPLIFFILMLLSTLLSSYKALRDFEDLFEKSPENNISADVENPFDARDAQFAAAKLAPSQEQKVQHLAQRGFSNRDTAIAALRASNFDLQEAELRLINSQPNNHSDPTVTR